MLREAELFVHAEDVLVEVLGRIRPDDRDIVLPPLSDLPGACGDTAIGTVVERVAADDADVPVVLGGGGPAEGIDPARASVEQLAAVASRAAGRVSDGDALVPARYGTVPARHYLLRLAVNRSLVAHYVASYLGSTACPLPEELARPLHELTQPDAAMWRTLGIFGEPMPVPPLASWRDTFLLNAGHLPHPLGH